MLENNRDIDSYPLMNYSPWEKAIEEWSDVYAKAETYRDQIKGSRNPEDWNKLYELCIDTETYVSIRFTAQVSQTLSQLIDLDRYAKDKLRKEYRQEYYRDGKEGRFRTAACAQEQATIDTENIRTNLRKVKYLHDWITNINARIKSLKIGASGAQKTLYR